MVITTIINIDKLLEYGINVNIPDNYGNYSYHYGVIENNIDFLKKIILNDKININLIIQI